MAHYINGTKVASSPASLPENVVFRGGYSGETEEEAAIVPVPKAESLSVSGGSNKQPVYFNNEGKPVAIDYTIESNVPADAKFTDTTYSAANAEEFGLVKIGRNITNIDGLISIGKDDVTGALGYVPPNSENAELIGEPKAPTAPNETCTTQIATTEFVHNLLGEGLAASDAMVVKGTIGTDGTVTALPTTYRTGWTYRVVTAGTYAGHVCEIGDLIIALVNRNGSGNADADWCVAQTNINGAITGIKGDNYLSTTASGSIVTVSHKDVARTDTTSTDTPTHGGTFTAVKSVTSDAKGHITAIDVETITLPTYGAAGSSLGLVKSGGDVTISNGVITVKDDSHNHTIANVDGLQDALDGKAASSHGTHVSFSTTAPVVAGTAAVGTAGTVSRSDHVHPAQTTVSGNAGTATKWKTARNINGLSIDGSANRVNYGTCSTAAATVEKAVACTGYALITGSEITVKFTVTNTAANPTLNVNSTGAKAIYYRGAAITAGYLAANRTYTFRYNGTQYELVGDINTDANTKNTAGSTDTSSKIFLIGATTQAANPQTYSHNTAFVGTDGHLYSNSKQVVNLTDTQTLTNKTITVAASTAYTTALVRNVVLTTTDPGAGATVSYPNGTIICVYE